MVVVLLVSLISLAGKASTLSDYALLPMPQTVTFKGGSVKLGRVAIDMPACGVQWTKAVVSIGAVPDSSARFMISGEIVKTLPRELAGVSSDEAYLLNISKKGVTVKALTEKGLYWALQTFVQLTRGTNKVPCCEIADFPAFPWRGFMMDVGRSYISVEELKREIDVMSKFKLNVFHWHLTENQAWRLESKIFPMLNDSVNVMRQPGKYYTLDEARELVEYAKAHNVLLVPEIDMPGHSAAFVKTFRHDMQSPEGMKILKLLMEEVCETFDVPYIHIGTDEVRFTNPSFVEEMVEFVRARGKKVISWNPGWNYKSGEIDMTTMWSYRGKPTQGIPAVDLRFHYINHFDVYADIRALYRSTVYGKKKADDNVHGVEIALWNDRYVENEASNIAQSSVYPAMMAVAERSWRGGGTEYFDSLGTNMADEGSLDFAEFADFERRLLWHKDFTLDSIYIPYVKQTNVKWRITDAFPNGGKLDAAFPPETEGMKHSYVYNDSTYSTATTSGAGIYLRHVWGAMVPSFYNDPKPNHTAYAFSKVYAPRDLEAGVQLETQNYSRSESDVPPRQGQWDYRGSKIWINGVEIEPPTWTSTHTVRDNEITLGNENFAARDVIPVKLHKGWNTVMLKLPVGEFYSEETRLVKWMFTCVFTTPDGSRAMPGLVYSTD